MMHSVSEEWKPYNLAPDRREMLAMNQLARAKEREKKEKKRRSDSQLW